MKSACAPLPVHVYSRLARYLKTIPHITEESEQALSAYTTSFYESINKGLRGGHPEFKLFAALMIAGLNKRPPIDDVTWRGMQLEKTDPLLEQITAGGNVCLPSFTSASKELEAAHRFMGEVVLPGKVKMLICIIVGLVDR